MILIMVPKETIVVLLYITSEGTRTLQQAETIKVINNISLVTSTKESFIIGGGNGLDDAFFDMAIVTVTTIPSTAVEGEREGKVS